MFVEHGAPKEILYMQKPHIGTDRLCEIVKSIREEIIALGGEVRFESKVTDLRIENKKVTGLEWNHEYWMDVEVLVLAIGHSARDTFNMIYNKKIIMGCVLKIKHFTAFLILNIEKSNLCRSFSN